MDSTKPIFQTRQIRELERLAEERFGISGQVMMQRAGKAAFDFLLHRFPRAQKIALFCGGGNNGGDGFVLAHYAKQHGLTVTIWQVGAHKTVSQATHEARLACEAAHIPIHRFNEKEELERPDVIVDALYGIGLHEPLREEGMLAIKKIHHVGAPIFSIDVPSGVDADTGRILGAAIQATVTMTFIGLKLGLLTGDGMAYTGELVCDDLQLPTELFAAVEPVAEKITLSAYATEYLKPRARHWHKGLSGHVLVVGGAPGFSGAPRLAAEAALRVGAGLVTIATHPEHAKVINSTRPEIMSHGVLHPADLKPLFARAGVVVIGPGLGQSDWSKSLWEAALQEDLPLVLDADGLNLLANTDRFNDNWVLTPHPGEAARLIDETTQTIQANRLVALQAIQQRYGGVCVLKGACSLILAADSLPALCDKGNPGMASAGMGDVLSGVIGGFIAQGIPLNDAAKMGVCVHAMAGDWAAKEGERGMVAMDLMPYLRRLSNLPITFQKNEE